MPECSASAFWLQCSERLRSLSRAGGLAPGYDPPIGAPATRRRRRGACGPLRAGQHRPVQAGHHPARTGRPAGQRRSHRPPADPRRAGRRARRDAPRAGPRRAAPGCAWRRSACGWPGGGRGRHGRSGGTRRAGRWVLPPAPGRRGPRARLLPAAASAPLADSPWPVSRAVGSAVGASHPAAGRRAPSGACLPSLRRGPAGPVTAWRPWLAPVPRCRCRRGWSSGPATTAAPLWAGGC